MIAAGGCNRGDPAPVDVWNVNGTFVTTLAGMTGQLQWGE